MMRSKFLVGAVLFACWVTAGVALAADAEKPLNNAEIVKLTKADLGDAVIIAKIKSAAAVEFATGTDDLVKLKQAGVSKDVITAMIDRSAATAPHAAAPAAAAAASAGAASVTLRASDGTSSLKSVDGDVRTIVAPFVGMKRFIVFPDVSATTRTKDHKPSVTIATDKDPHKVFWLVKLDPDKTDNKVTGRSMDVESPGMWGGVMSSAPDSDNQIKCDETEEKPGLWRLTPQKELKPGEYGVYVGKGESIGIVYDFGIDK
jgi:hypothetical protein